MPSIGPSEWPKYANCALAKGGSENGQKAGGWIHPGKAGGPGEFLMWLGLGLWFGYEGL